MGKRLYFILSNRPRERRVNIRQGWGLGIHYVEEAFSSHEMIIKWNRTSKQDSWDRVINIYYVNNIILVYDILPSVVSHDIILIYMPFP